MQICQLILHSYHFELEAKCRITIGVRGMSGIELASEREREKIE